MVTEVEKKADDFTVEHVLVYIIGPSCSGVTSGGGMSRTVHTYS